MCSVSVPFCHTHLPSGLSIVVHILISSHLLITCSMSSYVSVYPLFHLSLYWNSSCGVRGHVITIILGFQFTYPPFIGTWILYLSNSRRNHLNGQSDFLKSSKIATS